MVEIDLGLDAYLPTSYIEDERQKIEIYKRIRELDSQEALDELQDDLLDRFGEYPDEVAHLLAVGELKMNAERALVEAVKKQGLAVKITLSKVGTQQYVVQDLFKALTATKFKANMNQAKDKMEITLSLTPKMPAMVWLMELNQFMQALRDIKYEKQVAQKQTDVQN